ncbi:MAG: hypothetical protein WCA12_17600 [Burkholderiales bacterium]
MTSRRSFIAAAARVASAGPLETVLVQVQNEGVKQADFLLVQNAGSMTFDQERR